MGLNIEINAVDTWLSRFPAELQQAVRANQQRAQEWIQMTRGEASWSFADGVLFARPNERLVLSGKTRPELAGKLPVYVTVGGSMLSAPVRPDGTWSCAIDVPAAMSGLRVNVRVPTTTHEEIFQLLNLPTGSAMVSLTADDCYASKDLTLKAEPTTVQQSPALTQASPDASQRSAELVLGLNRQSSNVGVTPGVQRRR